MGVSENPPKCFLTGVDLSKSEKKSIFITDDKKAVLIQALIKEILLSALAGKNRDGLPPITNEELYRKLNPETHGLNIRYNDQKLKDIKVSREDVVRIVTMQQVKEWWNLVKSATTYSSQNIQADKMDLSRLNIENDLSAKILGKFHAVSSKMNGMDMDTVVSKFKDAFFNANVSTKWDNKTKELYSKREELSNLVYESIRNLPMDSFKNPLYF